MELTTQELIKSLYVEQLTLPNIQMPMRRNINHQTFFPGEEKGASSLEKFNSPTAKASAFWSLGVPYQMTLMWNIPVDQLYPSTEFPSSCLYFISLFLYMNPRIIRHLKKFFNGEKISNKQENGPKGNSKSSGNKEK